MFEFAWSIIIGSLLQLILIWGHALLLGLGTIALMVIDHKLS